MNIKDLQTKLRHFAAERDWQPFHDPKNLSTALMVEAAELAQIFQWMTPEAAKVAHESPDLKARIADEVADVLLYLLQVADHAQIDLAHAAKDKMARNAIKHPATRQLSPAPIAAIEPAGTHVLLDYENVQPDEKALKLLVPSVSDVWVFHGPHQKDVGTKFASFGNQAALVPISKTGKNALDFHLSYYMGYVTSRNPGARFVVVANDKGYDPMLDHARQLGFAVERQAFGGTPPATASPTPQVTSPEPPPPAVKVASKVPSPQKAPPKPAPVKQATAAKKAAAKKSAPKKTAAPVKATVAAKKTAQPVAKPVPTKAKAPLSQVKVIESLRKMGNKRPAKLASLRRTVQMLLGPASSSDAVTASINNLIAAGAIQVGSNSDLTFKL